MPSDFAVQKSSLSGTDLSRAQKKRMAKNDRERKEGTPDGPQAAGKSLWGDRKKLPRLQ